MYKFITAFKNHNNKSKPERPEQKLYHSLNWDLDDLMGGGSTKTVAASYYIIEHSTHRYCI